MASGPVIGSGQILITANTQPAVQAMQTLQGASTKATSSIVQQFTTAAKGIQSSPLVSNLETVSALFIQVGGSVSRAASLVTSLIRPVAILGTAFGSATAAIGAFAIPVAGLAVAGGGLFALSSAAVEAADRLEDLGIAVDNRAAVNLRTFSDASSDLGVAMDQLKVSVGADVAADVATLISAVAGGVRWFTATREAAREFAETMKTGLRIAVDIGTLTLSEHALALIDTAAAANKVADAEERITTTTLDAEAAIRKQLVALGMMVSIEDEDRAAKERQRLAAVALKEEEDRHLQAMQVLIDGYRARWEAANEAADNEVAAIQRIRQAQADAYEAQSEEIDAIMAKRQQEAADAEQDARDRAIREKQVYLGLAESAIGSIESITSTALIGYEQRIAAGEHLNRYEAKNANAALAAYEAIAIAQAGVSAALAGINSFASLTAIELNPFTAAATATALSTASFAAAVYSITAHKPFSFQPVDAAVRGHGEDPDYDPDDVYGHGAGDVPDDPKADKPRDLPGQSRSRSRSRRDRAIEVHVVNIGGNGKLRR